MTDAFATLGLTRDADERAIKRAYAALLRVHRPDDDPVGFQRINEAYAAALDACHAGDAPDGAVKDEDEDVRNTIRAWRATQAEGGGADDAGAPALEAGSQARAPVRAGTAPAPGDAAIASPAFDLGTFLQDLHAHAMADTDEELTRWLEARPELFDITLKREVAPFAVAMLEDQHEVPGRQIEAILAFFGLDTVDGAVLVSSQRVTALMERAQPSRVVRRELYEQETEGQELLRFLWPFLIMLFLAARCAADSP